MKESNQIKQFKFEFQDACKLKLTQDWHQNVCVQFHLDHNDQDHAYFF